MRLNESYRTSGRMVSFFPAFASRDGQSQNLKRGIVIFAFSLTRWLAFEKGVHVLVHGTRSEARFVLLRLLRQSHYSLKVPTWTDFARY